MRKKHCVTIVRHLWILFRDIKYRCNNPNFAGYKYYGGRGIKCLFRNTDEFRNYVIDELQIDPRGLQIDRIDNNGHYERGNIQFVSAACNMRKRRKITGKCSSVFKGVYWHKSKMGKSKWRARIEYNGKRYSLGLFINEIDAATAYDEAALEYFGDFALTNEMMGLYESEVAR